MAMGVLIFKLPPLIFGKPHAGVVGYLEAMGGSMALARRNEVWRTHHLKKGLPCWCGRVESLLMQEQIDAGGVDLG